MHLYAEKCWVLFIYPVCKSMSFYWGIESTNVEILRNSDCCFLLFLCLCGYLLLGLLEEDYFLAFSRV